jgi:hypothetical protein
MYELIASINEVIDLAGTHRMSGRFSGPTIDKVALDHTIRASLAQDRVHALIPAATGALAEATADRQQLAAASLAADHAVQEFDLRDTIGLDNPTDRGQLVTIRDDLTRSLQHLDATIIDVRQLLARAVVAPDEPIALGPEPEPARTARIVYEPGTDYERAIPMVNDRVTIGRKRALDLTIAGDARVSRVHCSIEDTGDGYRIVDHDSANGVLVDGELVENDRRLHGGEELIIGTSIVRFELG